MQRRFRSLSAGLLVSCAVLFVVFPEARQQDAVAIVVDSTLAPPAAHALRLLVAALESKGLTVGQAAALDDASGAYVLAIGGCTASPAMRALTQAAGVQPPGVPESLVIQNVPANRARTVVICGADDRGVMYAVHEVADHVRLSRDGANALASIPNAVEKPNVAVRSMSRMLMNRAVVEEYLYSQEFWDSYLTMLARNRYNTFTLMLGYGAAGYFEPPYPFLFDVPEFPEVKVKGLTAEEQERNLRMLNRIVDMTHERGLDFTLALWTHTFVPGLNNYLTEARSSFPVGLDEENLIPYTRVAFGRFLELVPGIDRLQFRVHVESSVTLPYQKRFWSEVFNVLEESGRRIPVDMRLKGFADDLIEQTLASPVPVRLTTKHWGEELGPPFHPTQDTLANKYERRHTYADVLTYPKRYDMLWRLWSHGTVKVLLWGSPEHARRFAESTHLYDGVGFDIHEPLAMKMGYKRKLHDVEPYDVLSPEYRHYRWEFERYWHYYQVFGRLGYTPRTPPRVWRAEFEHRFGPDAAPFVEQAYAAASKVLPRIVAYATRDLSAGFTWPEKQRWEDLPEYVDVEPSDTAQFLGISEAVRLYLQGVPSAKITPHQNSEWFDRVAAEIQRHSQKAEERIGSYRNKEFAATIVDMHVLAGLAAYHARRVHSGWHYALFQQTGDLHALDEAVRHERAAIEEWRQIVARTDRVYPDDIIMGREGRMTGSWKTELLALEKGLADLEKQRAEFRPEHRTVVTRVAFGDGPPEEGVQRLRAKQPYVPAKGGIGWHHEYLIEPEPGTKAGGETHGRRRFLHGPPPDEYADSAFGIDIPDGECELLFSFRNESPGARDHGPMWLVAEGRNATERFTIRAGQVVEKTLRTRVVDGRLDVHVSATTDGDWILDRLLVSRVEPVIGHVPVRQVTGEHDLTLHATVTGPDPIETVQLTYGTESSGYSHTGMTATGTATYEASVPRAAVANGFRYFITVEDASGRRVTLPRDGADEAFQVTITKDRRAPTVTHEKVLTAHPGAPLRITAIATDESGVDAVHVRYRGVNQHQDFDRLRLLPTGRPNEYAADIPAVHIGGRWDFMYYLEAFDTVGNGRIHPDLEVETPYVIVDLHPEPESAPSTAERSSR